MEKLDKKAIVILSINYFITILLSIVLIFLFTLVFWIEKFSVISNSLPIIIILSIVFLIVISIILGVLSYLSYGYTCTDSGLRVEKGILTKNDAMIPYEKIQNVEIRRGILARILGTSSIFVQTAGSSTPQYTEGVLPVIDKNKALELREKLMNKITKK